MAITASTASVGELLDAVETTLGAATSLASSVSYDELREGFSSIDCPLLMVYPAGGDCKPPGSTDRLTFGGGMRMSVLEVFVDLYARERSILKEDMLETVTLVDELIPLIEAQREPPFFGISPQNAIKSFTWNWKRATFRAAGSLYMGARFRFLLRLF